MPSPERIAIFIDGSNFYHGLRAMFQRTDIDFERFCQKICSDRKHVRSYYYIVPLNQKENPRAYSQQQKFFNYLDKVPYLERRLGRLVRRQQELQCPHCKQSFSRDFHLEKGVDVKIAMDMLDMAVKKIYDVAVLVSGDGDFSNAIKAVKELGLSVENAYFPRDPSGRTGHSWELMQVCDKFINLTADFMKDCWRR
jgi:uncharacterized LabA/DUF88 family protein